MSISGCDIPFSQSVRNLGFYLDKTLSVHILNTCAAFCLKLKKIRSFLPTDAANKLAVSLSLYKLEYCNYVLACFPGNKLNKLQRIQNHAARLVLRKPSYEKCNSTAQNTPLNTVLPYISDLHPNCPSRKLRSLITSLLTFLCFSLEFFFKDKIFLCL